jgi:hypothetical protein
LSRGNKQKYQTKNIEIIKDCNEYFFNKIYGSSEVAELLYTIAIKRTYSAPKASLSVGCGCQVVTSSRRETSSKFRRHSVLWTLPRQTARARETLLRPKSGKVHRDFGSMTSPVNNFHSPPFPAETKKHSLLDEKSGAE